MDPAVALALIVLAVVFLISFSILVVMCKSRYQYKRFLKSNKNGFNKLNQDNWDEMIQLSPLISQALDNNPWLGDATGILQHCVSILRLCHQLTETLSKVPSNELLPMYSDSISTSTQRILKDFDYFLKTLGQKNADLAVIEARACALVSSSFALTIPFSLMFPKSKNSCKAFITEMENHTSVLKSYVKYAEERNEALIISMADNENIKNYYDNTPKEENKDNEELPISSDDNNTNNEEKVS
ncbi:Transmembrane protein 98 [Strongyloides ratti]|uniref:Transmembrane protein 98 n=1 Tax=Strongyloides ratti TaxID=34506 RepID=A0A090LHH3_STRRB|nr:Transmembrane protein 98 [Strongyloides ratti]CEF66960.1 Transmembrane protein 98 [Strongyloides ratti]